MRYFGGKVRIGKDIALVLDKYLEQSKSKILYDVFFGAGNVSLHITQAKKIVANDIHYELMEMWKALQTGWQPPIEIPELIYNRIKNNQSQYPPEIVAFVGFGCSFAGKYFGGYARDSRGVNYAKSAYNSLQKKIKNFNSKNIEFIAGDYRDIDYIEGSVIYCDPPYQNSKGYSVGKFNHNEFNQWVIDMSKRGFSVLVSEYKKNIENDNRFKIIWEKQASKEIRNKTNQREKTIEVLYSPIN